jgi:hypothetical protein
MYLSWAAFYEGPSDAAYFNVLIPKLLEDILLRSGRRPYDIALAPAVEFGISRRSNLEASQDVCDRKNEFHIIFVQADAGGRGQQAKIATRREAIIDAAVERCEFDREIAVYLSPVKELEAWALCDMDALLVAFGVTRLPQDLAPASPREVERLADPKATLDAISIEAGQRRRSASSNLVRIAQEQSLSRLRMVPAFQDLEGQVCRALRHIGCLEN